jgi:hypothetical protein
MIEQSQVDLPKTLKLKLVNPDAKSCIVIEHCQSLTDERNTVAKLIQDEFTGTFNVFVFEFDSPNERFEVFLHRDSVEPVTIG